MQFSIPLSAVTVGIDRNQVSLPRFRLQPHAAYFTTDLAAASPAHLHDQSPSHASPVKTQFLATSAFPLTFRARLGCSEHAAARKRSPAPHSSPLTPHSSLLAPISLLGFGHHFCYNDITVRMYISSFPLPHSPFRTPHAPNPLPPQPRAPSPQPRGAAAQPRGTAAQTRPAPRSRRPQTTRSLRSISAGCGIVGAARYVGCAVSTIRREARRNPVFNEKLRRAHLAAELAPLNALRQAAGRHWRTAAWLLERADVQRYGKQNVRFIKPDQLKELTETVAEIVNHEINDDDAARRIVRRFEEMARRFETELAAELDPCPAPRGRPRPRHRPLAPPRPHERPHERPVAARPEPPPILPSTPQTESMPNAFEQQST